MSVHDPDVVDLIAQEPEGRVLLVMVEDRRYSGGDAEAMAEDFRRKLNAYVALIRSGGLKKMVGRRAARNGVDIQLSCTDEPPARVREILRLALPALEAEGIDLTWQVGDPERVEDLVPFLVELLFDQDMPDEADEAEGVRLRVTLVGDLIRCEFQAVLGDGTAVDLDEPEDDALEVVRRLKNAVWAPEHGTWLTLVLTADDDRDDDELEPEFDHGEPAGADDFDAEAWALEARRFPRADLPAWWHARLPEQDRAG